MAMALTWWSIVSARLCHWTETRTKCCQWERACSNNQLDHPGTPEDKLRRSCQPPSSPKPTRTPTRNRADSQRTAPAVSAMSTHWIPIRMESATLIHCANRTNSALMLIQPAIGTDLVKLSRFQIRMGSETLFHFGIPRDSAMTIRRISSRPWKRPWREWEKIIPTLVTSWSKWYWWGSTRNARRNTPPS